MSIPLYQGGATRSRARQAEYTSEQQKDILSDTRTELLAEAKSLWAIYHNALRRLDARTREINAILEAREGIQTEIRLGERSFQESLDIEQDLVDARIALIEAKYEKVISLVRLLALKNENISGSRGI